MLDRELNKKVYECALRLLALYKEANAGHVGSSLSCLQILCEIAFRQKGEDDFLILSKGHAAAALYVVLTKTGQMDEQSLASFYKDGTLLAAHPPCSGKIQAIPFGTGSLGHGLSLASGLALASKFRNDGKNAYCVLSEGDSNEGSTWEAALFASQQKLDNLIVIVDANGLQGFGTSKEVMDIEPLVEKWRAFGFETEECPNGNDVSALNRSLATFKVNDQPKCLIARTQKGFGVAYMQNKIEWHYLPMTDELYQRAQSELASTLGVGLA